MSEGKSASWRSRVCDEKWTMCETTFCHL